ncbi:hypothetical protein [Alienimonas sp. DA493]|uniref:hypothetical protein n=1 Tax=Alienimonas sp. DA493 TaxID=3373605 RepID=UPI00375452A0
MATESPRYRDLPASREFTLDGERFRKINAGIYCDADDPAIVHPAGPGNFRVEVDAEPEAVDELEQTTAERLDARYTVKQLRRVAEFYELEYDGLKKAELCETIAEALGESVPPDADLDTIAGDRD